MRFTGHSVESPFSQFSGTYSASGGRVQFVANINGSYVTEATTVATLSFSANASSGSATVSLSGSGAAYAGDATNPVLGSSTIHFLAPPEPPATPPPQPSKPSTPPTTKDPAKTPTKDTPKPAGNTPVVASKVSAVTPGFTKVQLSLQSSAPTSVYISYSSDGKNYQSTKPSEFAPSHQIDLSGLAPGGTYYYQVVSKDESGHITKSDVSTIHTKGLTVTVEVQDKNYQPLKSKKVSLHSTPQTVQTNDAGLATFTNVAPGAHTVSYTDGGQTYSEGLVISNNVQLTAAGSESSAVQKLFVVLPFSQGGSSAVLWVIVAAVAVLILVIAVISHRRKSRPAGAGATQNSPDHIAPEATPTGVASIRPDTVSSKPDASAPLSGAPSTGALPGSLVTPSSTAVDSAEHSDNSSFSPVPPPADSDSSAPNELGGNRRE